MTTISKNRKSVYRKGYGVTEKKKAELDLLTLQVLDAQQQVDQFQSIVTSLTSKLTSFQGFLATASTNRTNSLNTKNIVDQVVQNFLDLQNNSSISFNAIATAQVETGLLAKQISEVMGKLIYSAEVINKLATYVVRKKAMNPLVSDELVSTLATAGTDANNAVALTLVALQSAYASQASSMQTQDACSLEYIQAMAVYQFLTGTDANGNPTANYSTSLQQLLYTAYETTKSYYDEIYNANQLIAAELNNAQLSLNAAQVSLQSLQLGLAAGNAAALAS